MMSSSLYLVFEYMEHDLASLAAVQTTKFSEAQKLLWMILKLLIERMFGLEGLLNDPGSGWKLVYVDFESDVLLVGNDPWEEFVGCVTVRCIRILSPCEVKQMGEEGMQLLNSAAAMQQDLVGGAAPKD